MKYEPKTESEIAREGLLESGEYDFEVIHAEDAKSKKSNDMIKLKLRVFAPGGGEKHIYDYLLEKLAYKLAHFCRGTGLESKYAAGELAALDCLGKCGRVKIAVDDKNPDYPPKNVVKDYICSKSNPASQTQSKSPPPPAVGDVSIEKDDIPF